MRVAIALTLFFAVGCQDVVLEGDPFDGGTDSAAMDAWPSDVAASDVGPPRVDTSSPACNSLTRSQCDERTDCRWKTEDGFPGPISYCDEGRCDEPAIRTVYVDSEDGMECEVEEAICLTSNSDVCPQPAPPPADWCSDGTIETVANYTIESTDGQLCTIPEVYCLIIDRSSCPMNNPPPIGWCSGGEVVSGDRSYVVAAVDPEKYCPLESRHCLTRDSSKCPTLAD